MSVMFILRDDIPVSRYDLHFNIGQILLIPRTFRKSYTSFLWVTLRHCQRLDYVATNDMRTDTQ
jgi:hypothetical protein